MVVAVAFSYRLRPRVTRKACAGGAAEREGKLDFTFLAGQLDVFNWTKFLLHSVCHVPWDTGWFWGGEHVGAAVDVDYFAYVQLTHRDRCAMSGICAKAPLQSPGPGGPERLGWDQHRRGHCAHGRCAHG